MWKEPEQLAYWSPVRACPAEAARLPAGERPVRKTLCLCRGLFVAPDSTMEPQSLTRQAGVCGTRVSQLLLDQKCIVSEQTRLPAVM